MFKQIIKLIFYIPFKLLFPLKVIGRENLKKIDSGAVFACNHYSNVDGIIITLNLFNTNFNYLSKKELAKNRFMRWFMTKLGAVFINRKTTDISAMKRVLKDLKSGSYYMIFPEGTRNKTKDDNMQEMRNGVTYFAGKSNSYIVPMLIEKRPKLFRINRLIIGEPYKIELIEKSDTEKETKNLEKKLNNLKEVLKTNKGDKK